jgi:hypothetical protein
MSVRKFVLHAVLMGVVCLPASRSFAWHDATHMAVMKAAGLDDLAYLAVGPDMAKEKAGDAEGPNHYNNTRPGVEVTAEMVLSQFRDYNKTEDADGHLYGAIVASLTDYVVRDAGGKYAIYPLGYAAHYIGDLSMPLHNVEYDAFNKLNHSANDGIVEKAGLKDERTEAKVARIAAEISKRMAKLPPLRIAADIKEFYPDLAAGIAAVANRSIAIGRKMQGAVPPRSRMTEDEAYDQLALSAQLLKAVYQAVSR